MSLVRAVGVGALLPVLGDEPELFERQRLGRVDQRLSRLAGQLVAATRVRPQSGQLTHGGDRDHAGVQVVGDLG